MTEEKEEESFSETRFSETLCFLLIGEILGIVFILFESTILLANQ